MRSSLLKCNDTYLKAENRILRNKLPDRITLSNQERRTLVRHGKKLGARIKELISIVTYSTFRKWVRSVEGVPDKRPEAKQKKPVDRVSKRASVKRLFVSAKKPAGDTPRLFKLCGDLVTRSLRRQ